MTDRKREEWEVWPEEPWVPGENVAYFDLTIPPTPVTQSDTLHLLNRRMYARAEACVNALAGIRNPAAVREVIEIAEWCIKQARYDQPMTMLREALAALSEEPPE